MLRYLFGQRRRVVAERGCANLRAGFRGIALAKGRDAIFLCEQT